MKNFNMRVSPAIDGQGARQMIGLGVVLTVLLVFMVVWAYRGRLIGGESLARPLGSAPGIGDCVVDDWHRIGIDLAEWGPDLPALEMGPCTGPRFGEVVYVEPNFRESPVATERAEDPYSRCSTRADSYLEIPPRLVPESGVPVPSTTPIPKFLSTPEVLIAFIGPDVRGRAAGEKWAACVVYLPASIDAEAPITVDHSLRGSWLRDDDQRLFSLCLGEPTSDVALNCNWPHRLEMIGRGWGNPDDSQVSVDQACRDSVIQALGSPAAVVGGTVTPVVLAVRPNPNNDGGMVTGPGAVTAGSPYFNFCFVTATESDLRLTAPLRGIGDAPVPLS